MNSLTIDLYPLFHSAINLINDWLNISVSFAGVTFNLWAIFGFIILLGIFLRVLGALGGFDFGDDSTVGHSFHIGGFHD